MHKLRIMVAGLLVTSTVLGEGVTNVFFDIKAFCQLDAFTNSNVEDALTKNYNMWLHDFRSMASIREKNLFMEKWLNIAYGIKPVAYTNGVDYFTSSYYVFYFDMMEYTMTFIPEATTNEMFKLPLARYIGSIKELPYKRRTTAGRVSGGRTYMNQDEQEKYNLQRVKFYKMQRHDDEMERQNRQLMRFRELLFSVSSYSMPQLRNSMSCDEFTSFTNNFVIESKASEKEQKILFERL